MPASYPASVVSFPTFVDYVSVDAANNVNTLHDEIVAIETALGPNANILNDPAHTPGTVAYLIDQLNSGKSATTHTHSGLLATTIGGPSTGLAVKVTQNQMQGQNNGAATTMFLQFNGGDLRIGSANCQVTVAGALTATGSVSAGSGSFDSLAIKSTALFQGGLTVQGGDIHAESSNLDTHNVNAAGTVFGGVFSVTGASYIDFGGGNVIRQNGFGFSGAGILLFDGDTVNSRKQINGQLVITADKQFGLNGWSQACALFSRTYDTNTTIAFYSHASGGAAFCLSANSDQQALGFQALDESGTIPIPITVSHLFQVSSIRGKSAVQGLAKGLDLVKQLSPVSYLQAVPDHFAPTETVTDEDGLTVEQPVHGQRREERRAEQVKSPGDITRHATRSIGLIAEDVHPLLPEVVGLDHEGKPAAIDYGSIVPVLIQAIKELADEVAALRAKVEA